MMMTMDRDRSDQHVGDEGERAGVMRAAGRSPRTAKLPSGAGPGAAPRQAKADRPAAPPAWGDATLDPFGVHLQDAGGGDRMPATVQRQMESSFAADFSAVRV